MRSSGDEFAELDTTEEQFDRMWLAAQPSSVVSFDVPAGLRAWFGTASTAGVTPSTTRSIVMPAPALTVVQTDSVGHAD